MLDVASAVETNAHVASKRRKKSPHTIIEPVRQPLLDRLRHYFPESGSEIRRPGRSTRRRSWQHDLRSIPGVAILLYCVAVTLLAVTVRTGGDVSSIGTLLLFAPRHWLLAPWALLLPLAILKGWRLALTATIGVLLTVFGANSFATSVNGKSVSARHALRLVTLNTDGSPMVAYNVHAYLQDWDADVVLFQDCTQALGEAIDSIANSTSSRDGEFCIASRLPVIDVDILPKKRYSTTGGAARYRLLLGTDTIDVVNVHIASPRTELSAARYGDLGLLTETIATRSRDSWSIREFAAGGAQHKIVAGDFNLPVGSAILREQWSHLSNAFDQAGFGFGFTMHGGVYRFRIDHVLVSPSFRAERARVLKGYTMQHQPVVVDLAWR
jgi:vancomycin resistance protein VanJ